MRGTAAVANINDVVEGHAALEVECVDRLLLNAYVPNLQVGGQVSRFITGHLGKPIASAAVLGSIGNRFRNEVKRFADREAIPILKLKGPDRSRWDDRKLDHVRPYLDAAERERRFGVVAIVAGQEFAWVFSARTHRKGKALWFEFFREQRRVGVYYFYILDPDFGPAFIKLCTYFPYPARVWVNGHEWAKRQADHAGIDYRALSNGFAATPQPERLQAICDSLAPGHIQAFFDRWMACIPTPLTAQDRAAGYWWQLSIRQVEISRTLVLDEPRRARGFFEALVADNIAIGRPEQVAMVFARPLRRPAKTTYGTRVFTTGTDVRIDFRYQHWRIKQYLKDRRALRVETVINNPSDLDIRRRIEHLGELVAKARQVNHRLLIIERAGQSCAIGSALLSASTCPTTVRAKEPERCASATHAPWPWPGALCHQLHAVAGFTNKTLRQLVAAHLGTPYNQNRMSYDLRRLRLHGLIRRLPRSNTYLLTPDGIRIAAFHTKPQNRLLRPLLEADKPPAPTNVRRALTTLEHAVNDYINAARLTPPHETRHNITTFRPQVELARNRCAMGRQRPHPRLTSRLQSRAAARTAASPTLHPGSTSAAGGASPFARKA